MRATAKFLLATVLGLMLAAPAGAESTTFLTIGSGSTSGLYYPTAVGIARIVNDADVNLRANARSTGASVFNANAIGEGSLQMGMMQNNIAFTPSTARGCRRSRATRSRTCAG